MFNLVLFGPPGSGKGTQSISIIEKYKLIHVSTGDLLRNEVSNETPLGLEAKKYMDLGMLVPDEVVIGMISTKLDENTEANGFIFDGFPRTVAQAEALDNLLEFKNNPITVVLSLKVSENELKKRLISRGEVSGRSDDNEEVIAKRIKEYHAKTAPVSDYYKHKDKLVEINGEGEVSDVFNLISNQIDTFIIA
ncbi:MAG: adenylate kinase [Chitinophagaceae bacterium]|nr:MAG: adenylate kinase [Bacteroidetes bacterium OLB11]MCC6447080.1 adenylate kinase [Chitinophagaceae bacterium]HMN32234.1 adenylate kinase [Chitinophagaceae bacterium]